MREFSIGNVRLKNNLILAPMAGVTDLPFRLLCSEQGAGMVCMEMISAKAIYYHNKNTESLLEIHPDEGPVSLQLFGSDADIMSEMAKKIEGRPFSVLDVNMGCPVPKVVNNHEGSALMKEPKLVAEIVSKLVKAVNKPVTVKIRKGFDDEHVNAVEIAKIAQECGAAAVAVHGRTRQQYYLGEADWEIIAAVKDALSIPVIGNGDVTDEESAQRMFEKTGCDAIMIGRAARGNPFLFKQLSTYFETGKKCKKPSPQEVCETILRHADLQMKYKGEYTAVREMRKHIAWYSTGFKNSARLRAKINEMESMDDLMETVSELFANYERGH